MKENVDQNVNAVTKELTKNKNLYLRLYNTINGAESNENDYYNYTDILQGKTCNGSCNENKNTQLNHLEIQFLIDTGAECSLINYDTFKEIWIN